MALTIAEATDRVLDILATNNFPVAEDQRASLRDKGYCRLAGFNCHIANTLGSYSFRARVNMDWFKRDQGEIQKPCFAKGYPRPEFDFELFPIESTKLLGLYYTDLRSYCLQLENNTSQWFKKAYWGITVDPITERFSWKGGNTRSFPLLRIRCPDDLRIGSAGGNS